MVFFTLAVGPGFFSTEMLQLLGRPYAGAAAQVILSRYFDALLWCGILALVHLGVEYFYSGRPINKRLAGLLAALLVVGWASGSYIQPKLKDLHLRMHAVQTTAAQKLEAKKSFGRWHGVSQGINLLALVGVLVYYWTLTSSPSTGRYNMQMFRN